MLEIVRYPDPFLRGKSEAVAGIDDSVRRLAREMIETMYANRGLGLAAPQVRVHLRLAIVDLDPERRDPRVLVNPAIIRRSRSKDTGIEGCLSLPGVEAQVKRPAEVTVRALDLEGKVVEYQARELAAKAFQHEIDHLDGILFIDKVSPAGRQAIRQDLARLEQDFAAAGHGR